jgi:hypothetical protein
MPANPASKRRRFWLTTLTALLLTFVVGLVVWIGGRVTGEEFTPTHFTRREFRFWELPLLGWQVTPIHRKSLATPTINLLRGKGYINVPTQPPRLYHPVQIAHGMLGEPQPGDAHILVDYLMLEDDGTYIWQQWTRDHPRAAAVLWPEVQKLAFRELYVLIPELFSIAERTTAPQDLAAAIQSYLRTAYFELAEDLAAAGQPQMASELLEEASDDFPDDPRIEQLRRRLSYD